MVERVGFIKVQFTGNTGDGGGVIGYTGSGGGVIGDTGTRGVNYPRISHVYLVCQEISWRSSAQISSKVSSAGPPVAIDSNMTFVFFARPYDLPLPFSSIAPSRTASETTS